MHSFYRPHVKNLLEPEKYEIHSNNVTDSLTTNVHSNDIRKTHQLSFELIIIIENKIFING